MSEAPNGAAVSSHSRLWPRRWVVAVSLSVGTVMAGGTAAVAVLLRTATGDLAFASAGADFVTVAAAAGHLALFSIAIGTLTMAVIEAAKRLTPIRGLMFRSLLNRELRISNNISGISPAEVLTQEQLRGSQWRTSQRFSRLAWFDVGVEQLVAQVGAIAESQLDAVLELIRRDVDEPEPIEASVVGMLLGYADATALVGWARRQMASRSTTLHHPGDVERDMRELAALLRGLLDRELNRLHIVLGGTWRWALRVCSCALAGILAVSILSLAQAQLAVSLLALPVAIVVGGFFSWLARDVVAGLERFRR